MKHMQKDNISRNSDKTKTISRKGTRGKMTPLTSSIQPHPQTNQKITKIIFVKGNLPKLKNVSSCNFFLRLGVGQNVPVASFCLARTLSGNGLIFVRIPWFSFSFVCFRVFFDLTCTFQVPRLSGTCLLYVKDLDLYPKCPPYFDLSRNVSIFVVRVHVCGQIILP